MPFIVLEGLDGAGKTTQLNKLISLLDETGVEHEYLHFPRFNAPVYGELIARFLRGEFGGIDSVDPYIVALLFAGDRADAAPLMKQWMAEGKYVITDRFVYSNIAFQCAKYDDGRKAEELKEWIFDLEFNYNKLPLPDISLFLDVPFDFTASRLAEAREGDDRDYLKGARDIHEDSLELQKKVRQTYFACARNDERLHIVDCSDGNGSIDTPDSNFKKIYDIIRPLLP